MDMDPNDIPKGGPWDRHANPAPPPSRLGRRDQSQRREDVLQRRVAGSKPLAGLGFPVFPQRSTRDACKGIAELADGRIPKIPGQSWPAKKRRRGCHQGYKQLGQGTWLHAGPLCPL